MKSLISVLRLVAVTLLLAMLLVPKTGWAADLTKAPAATPASPPCSISFCEGWFVGPDLSGIATNMNVFVNGLAGSINAGGTRIGGHGGYRYYDGKIYVGFDAGCAYDVSSGTTGIGISPSDRLFCTELLRGGGSLMSLFNVQQSSFQFPAALQNSFMSFYGIVGAAQRLSATGVASGIGAEFVFTPKLTGRLEYLNVQYGGGGATSNSAPGLSIPSENTFKFALDYNF